METSLMNERRRTIGDNRGPPLLTAAELRSTLAEDNASLIARRDQLMIAAERVPEIDSEDIARQVSDFIKQIMACMKALEGARVATKEPFLELSRAVDGFYKETVGSLERAKLAIEKRLTSYLRDKADKERHEREEAARLAREEEDRKRREAEAAAQKIKDEQTLAAAVEAEKQADVASADATKAEKEAAAKPAELSRTRGEYGAVSSLRTSWTFRDLDRAALDLEALRQHIPTDGLEKAVRSFIRAGGRELPGVEIYEETGAVVR